MTFGGETTSEHGEPNAAVRSAFAVILTVAVGATVANVFRAPPLQSANDRSRWSTVESLLGGHRFVIDEIDADPRWSTIDKVRHEGHFYSTKPPLLPTLVAGVAWCVERASGLDLRHDTKDVVPWVLVFVNVLPMLAAWIVLARMVERYAATDFARIFVVGTAAFGTLLTPFLVTLNNHVVAAWSTVFALAAAARILVDGDRRGTTFAVCGFFAGFTCTNELPAAAMGVALFVLLLRTDPRRTLAVFVPAALPPLIAYLALNVHVTGGLKPFYAYYGTEKYLFVHEGVPSYWTNPTGVDAARDSFPVYLFHCTFGHHGIWSLSPVFLLTLAGWATSFRGKRGSLALPNWAGLGLTVLVLGFYLTRTENYNYGGHAAGLRWLLWLVPFWLIAMIGPLDRWQHRRGLRAAALVALAISTYSAWYSARTPWQQPWLFDVMTEAGWIDYSDPPPELERPLHTLFRSLPGLSDDGEPRWIEFASTLPAGTTERLRLTDLGAEDRDGRRVHRVRLRRTLEDRESEIDYLIDAEAFSSGKPTGEFLLAVDQRSGTWPSSADRLHGLPTAAAFEAERTGYEFVPLRRDAFGCVVARASIAFRSDEDAAYRNHHCETWLTDAVPFGVVRFRTTISHPATGDVLFRRNWDAVAASDFPPHSTLTAPPE